MKAFITAALLTVSTFANAGEINLKCNYINLDGGTNTARVWIDATKQTMSVRDTGATIGRTGPLVSTGDVYGTKVGETVYSVHRETLEFRTKFEIPGIDTSTLKGTCVVVKSSNKI